MTRSMFLPRRSLKMVFREYFGECVDIKLSMPKTKLQAPSMSFEELKDFVHKTFDSDIWEDSTEVCSQMVAAHFWQRFLRHGAALIKAFTVGYDETFVIARVDCELWIFQRNFNLGSRVTQLESLKAFEQEFSLRLLRRKDLKEIQCFRGEFIAYFTELARQHGFCFSCRFDQRQTALYVALGKNDDPHGITFKIPTEQAQRLMPDLAVAISKYREAFRHSNAIGVECVMTTTGFSAKWHGATTQ